MLRSAGSVGLELENGREGVVWCVGKLVEIRLERKSVVTWHFGAG